MTHVYFLKKNSQPLPQTSYAISTSGEYFKSMVNF